MSDTPPRTHIRGLPRTKRSYDRGRDLATLLSLWPADIKDDSPHGRLALLAKLRKALREERRRGISGHWSYDVARHAALRNAYRAEVAMQLATPAHSMPAATKATDGLTIDGRATEGRP